MENITLEFEKIVGKIDENLKLYIENHVFPEYEKNESAHGLSHILYVIRRSLIFANQVTEPINLNMVYVIAAYHDIGHHIDAKSHEKISASILEKDTNLKNFFTPEEIAMMKEAVEDHRASSKTDPRNIYGKIVSSADRNTNVNNAINRSYSYRLKHSPNATLEEMIEESRQHLKDKFGKGGYATQKMYFEDKEYTNYLDKIDTLVSDKEAFRNRFMEVNNLN
ncbi:MAG: HD domain-containing protein [Clostridia bacterium]